MSAIGTSAIPSLDLVPELNRDFDPRGMPMTPEDYFVLTRVDGHLSFKQIVLITGFPEPQAVAILRKLREAGAILLKGEAPPPSRLRSAGTTPPAGEPVLPRRPVGNRPSEPPRLTEPVRPAENPRLARRTQPPIPDMPADVAAAGEDLSPEQRLGIWQKHATLAYASLFDLLEVPPDADKRAIKRSYFRISKDFHPDRFYGKRLGPFADLLAAIFKACSDAWEVLEDDTQRAAYLQKLGNLTRAPSAARAAAEAGQSKSERAAELFEAACQHEFTGLVAQAMQEFRAAIALDPLARYARRAAEASLRANELSSAEEYAKKFAAMSDRDPQAHRLVAKVLRARGHVAEALVELEMAIRLEPDNVHIAAELDEVKAQLGR